jgi:signal transduction histidine kinase
VPDETTLKALDKLVHDLRTPLGVAVGYLRLLRDHQLPAAEDQQRALTQTVEALGAMSRLCQEASSFAAAVAGAEDLESVSAAMFTAELAEYLPSPLAIVDADGNLDGSVRARRGGATVRAVAALLSAPLTAGGGPPSTDIIVRVAAAHLHFLIGAPEQREAMLLGQRQVFDPWRAGPGLAVPLACFEVSQASGEVFSHAAGSAAVAVRLPLEAKA